MDNSKKLIVESDWLGSKPVFYNEVTGAVSYNINDVIDFENFEWSLSGLYDYLAFGYSAFEQTPIKNVKFLRWSSRLWEDKNKLIVEYLPDPVEKWIDQCTNEKDALDLIEENIGIWENSLQPQQRIVIPTSGGYDSRLLNYFIKEKDRIDSFTYGISPEQNLSSEVIKAQELSQRLKIKWEQIVLGNYHDYLSSWDRLYGPSVHSHGMYHMEFYTKIVEKIGSGHALLSGIIGDVWAGTVQYVDISSYKNIEAIGFSHGLCADKTQLKKFIRSKEEIFQSRQRFWNEYREKLLHPKYQVVMTMRLKIILLSYLMRIPEKLGFVVWSPFLEMKVAGAMLTISEQKRKDRDWQRQFFDRVGLNFENPPIAADYRNSLDLYALWNKPLPSLDFVTLSEVIDKNYVKWINSSLRRFKENPTHAVFSAQNAWYTLYPLQSVIYKSRMWH